MMCFFFPHSLHCLLASLLVFFSTFLLWFVGVFLVRPCCGLLMFISTPLLCFVGACWHLLAIVC